MKPIYEPIIPSPNTSFKVKSYAAESSCEVAGWHIHPEYEIVYVKNGAGTLKIGTKTHHYENGVLVFLGGNIPHSDFGNNEKSNRQEVVVQFSKEFVDKKISFFPELDAIKRLIEKSKYILIFDDKVKTDLGKNFERFMQLNNQDKLLNLLSILSHLSNAKNYIKLSSLNMLHEFREKETYRLKKVFEYLNTHYNQKIIIDDIATKIGLTPNSFSRFFKKMTNRTFIDFVNELRIEKAVDRMNEGSVTIAEAMYYSGFNSPSYFAKQFKKYQVVTPSNYLKNIERS